MNFCPPWRTADPLHGPGFRLSLFVSGCRLHCPGCSHRKCWDFDAGKRFTKEHLDQLLADAKSSNVSGLSILGGEPMDINNQPGVSDIVLAFRKKFPRKSIWVYTGYLLENDLDPGRPMYTLWTPVIMDNIDALVDGPFVKSLHFSNLKYKGSSNQRIIYLKDGKPIKIE